MRIRLADRILLGLGVGPPRRFTAVRRGLGLGLLGLGLLGLGAFFTGLGAFFMGLGLVRSGRGESAISRLLIRETVEMGIVSVRPFVFGGGALLDL